MENEIWKDIEGYEGLYQISNLGNVKSLSYTGPYGVFSREKILKGNVGANGYMRISLSKNKKNKFYYLHRLIGIHFIDNKYNLPQINHINGIRTDNRIENLEWCTNQENTIHSYKHLNRKACKGLVGILNSKSKKINQYTLEGVFVKKWDCITDVERCLGFNHSGIVSCAKGKAKTAYGYKWKYYSLNNNNG